MEPEILERPRKTRMVLIIITVVVLLGLISGGIVYFYPKLKSAGKTTSVSIQTTAPATTTTSESSDQAIMEKFANYQKTTTEKMTQMQSLGSSGKYQEAMSLSKETQSLLEEFKTFLNDNKTVLEKNGVDVSKEITTVENNLATIKSRGGSESSQQSPPSTSSAASFSISLPFDKENFVIANMGVWPFCVHGGDHPEGHGGIDFDLKADTEIKAVADGKVEEMMYVEGEGYNVMISHEKYALATGYTPIKDPKVSKGDSVKKDQVLGPVGADLKGTPFLHFEIDAFTKGGRVCPYLYFNSDAKADFDQMFSQSHYPEQSSEPNICNCELVPVKR